MTLAVPSGPSVSPSMRTLGGEVIPVVEAIQRPIDVPRSRSQSMTLLYFAAVQLQAGLVRRRGLSFRFSGGFARPGRSRVGRLARTHPAVSLQAVQDQLQVSRSVVSRALARSASWWGRVGSVICTPVIGVAAVLKFTPMTWHRFTPLICTIVPTVPGPSAGETEVTDGAGALTSWLTILDGRE